jgi:spore coat polysaccharide biosynthesis predicted glycosyltransferase SpsG
VLAEEAISRGIECVFVGEISGMDWVQKRINSLGFGQIVNMDLETFKFSNLDTVILDSYTLPFSSQFNDPKRWKEIVSISDEVTPDFAANLVVNQRISKLPQITKGRRTISGVDYLLIRKDIRVLEKKEGQGEPIKIVVIGGGSDQFNFCQNFAKSIPRLKLAKRVQFDLFSPVHLGNISNNQFEMISHPIGPSLDLVARSADLAITLASTISFEFLARNIPMGVAAAIENQKFNYQELISNGFAQSVGHIDKFGKWTFDLETIARLINSQELRIKIASNMSKFTPVNGARNVFNEITNL